MAAHASGPDPAARVCRPDGTPSERPEWVCAGQDVSCALQLTNSTDKPARFIYRFETSADGRIISTDEDTDLFAAGASVLLPVRFRVPDTLAPGSSGTIRLLAVIDGVACTDEVPFQVSSPRPAPESSPGFDTARALSDLLQRLLAYAASGMPSREALNPPAQSPGTNEDAALPAAAAGGPGAP